MAEWIFWGCLGIAGLAYIGLPLMVLGLARLSPRPLTFSGGTPSVSIVIAAHNEAAHIGAKIRSLLMQDYPSEQLEIIVASDGSDDGTVEEARAVGDARVRVLDLPRGGKAAALNAAAPTARGEILVFTDADNRWRPDTLRALVAPFADPRVGAAGGHIDVVRDHQSLGQGDRSYRRFETWLRHQESLAGCMVSADGALLALRRNLFESVPPDVTDDFFLSTSAPAQGYRIVFAEGAVVEDGGVDKADRQYRRRVRVTVRGLQSLRRRAWLMNPLQHGRYALALVLHKLLRRLAPVLLLPLWLANLWLLDASLLHPLILLGSLCALSAGIAGILDTRGRLPKPFRLAGFALVTLSGMFMGVVQFLRGTRYSVWNPQQNR